MKMINPLSLGQAAQYDGGGIYGSLLHYAAIAFFVGGAFIIFIYLWKKGRLDMDEDPKIEMMKTDQEREKEEKLCKQNGETACERLEQSRRT